MLEILTLPSSLDAEAATLTLAGPGYFCVVNTHGRRQVAELLVATNGPLTSRELQIMSSRADGRKIDIHVDIVPAGTVDDVAEKAGIWKEMVETFYSLDDIAGYGRATLSRVILTIDEADWARKTPPVAIHLTWKSFGIDGAANSLYLLATKIASIAEADRFERQQDYNTGILGELEAYLSKPRVPILEPDSRYELAMSWASRGNDIQPTRENTRHCFDTEQDPPETLGAYLLATYPVSGEIFHPASHPAGFSIAASDILRLFKKFPDAAFRIAIVEHGGADVIGRSASGKPLNWTDGLVYRPADLLSVTTELEGLDKQYFDALPSPLLRAIKEAMRGGKLDCLAKAIELDKGLWIGLFAELIPLHHYTVTITLVRAPSGDPWWADPRSPLLSWSFRTGLHLSLTDHATALAREYPRARLGQDLLKGAFVARLESAAEVLAVDEEYIDLAPDRRERAPRLEEIKFVPEKILEDILCDVQGERARLTAETDLTFLWDGSGEEPVVTTVVLRSREPFLKQASSARLEKLTSELGSTDVLALGTIYTRYPALAVCTGITALYVSSAGTAIVAMLDPQRDPIRDVSIGMVEYAPHYLPHGAAAGAKALLTIAADRLTR